MPQNEIGQSAVALTSLTVSWPSWSRKLAIFRRLPIWLCQMGSVRRVALRKACRPRDPHRISAS
ncbi:unnamed protein product [Haemonchus placei]|uniref:Uncharacterized protein n=1 Tax=Haemonchus placei TaxID=6290 RepID=A0A3P8BYX4_HAEPC|nr:unnamed protein product [Haemonchus placei]